MTDAQYVIVHRRVRPHATVDTVFDLDPDDNLARISERATDLQHDANVRYGRPNDTYRVAELRYVDEAGR
jgi:hypothetical protein